MAEHKKDENQKDDLDYQITETTGDAPSTMLSDEEAKRGIALLKEVLASASVRRGSSASYWETHFPNPLVGLQMSTDEPPELP
jgi:hypothetical protein